MSSDQTQAQQADGLNPGRKRISRACDQCNALRTRCDGAHPCRHCVDNSLSCEFNRERKKRGKAPKSSYSNESGAYGTLNGTTGNDSLPRRAGSTSSPYVASQSLNFDNDSRSSADTGDRLNTPMRAAMELPPPPMNAQMSMPGSRGHGSDSASVNTPNEWKPMHEPSPNRLQMDYGAAYFGGSAGTPMFQTPGSAHNYLPGPGSGKGHMPQHHGFAPSTVNPTMQSQAAMASHTLRAGPRDGINVNHILAPQPAPHQASQPQHSRHEQTMPRPGQPYDYGQSPRSTYSESPRAFPAPPSKAPSSQHSHGSSLHFAKYPILQPVLKELEFIPPAVLCDMLDTYFNNSSYVLGYVLRRRDVLHREKPRKTTLGLLYAILCVGAHTCENAFLAATPVSRAKAVQRLFELSVSSLRPLQHDEVGGGCLDDVMTYLQLGTVIAASEFKGVSLRWFYSAWTLAKELRLNHELQSELPEATSVSETTKEERRRTWWLLYMIDRHLCLCYNKPLVLMDVECTMLFRPMDETVWQSDVDLDLTDVDGLALSPEAARALSELYETGRRGPSFYVEGPGIFGFFLPLMVILGEICTITSLTQLPGMSFDATLEPAKQQVRHHLHRYESSLARWQDPDLQPPRDMLTNPTILSPGTFAPYAGQLMHTLHILLCGKWDPIEMLENSAWISTSEFLGATGHAVSAAGFVETILRIDPDLAFMPFFFGIYLLQGSFLLLLLVDKLEQQADASVIDACETYIRAHEVCVVTLDTQYQRNFRRVMRSTLNSVRMRVHSSDEEKQKRRELLTLYRWADGGRGLVI
ncbi:hypothetical protein PYCC9005_006005 [Savitreella phatthalungensis]